MFGSILVSLHLRRRRPDPILPGDNGPCATAMDLPSRAILVPAKWKESFYRQELHFFFISLITSSETRFFSSISFSFPHRLIGVSPFFPSISFSFPRSPHFFLFLFLYFPLSLPFYPFPALSLSLFNQPFFLFLSLSLSLTLPT